MTNMLLTFSFYVVNYKNWAQLEKAFLDLTGKTRYESESSTAATIFKEL